MRESRLVFRREFVTAVILGLAVASQCETSGQKQRRFDPDGSFWIVGTPPNEFSDFGGINLNAKGLKRLQAPGVDLSTGRRFRYKTLSVSREQLKFRTVTVGGISYGFLGRFLKGGIFASDILDDETPVLEGTLTKFRSGKKVAEARLKFVYFGGT